MATETVVNSLPAPTLDITSGLVIKMGESDVSFVLRLTGPVSSIKDEKVRYCKNGQTTVCADTQEPLKLPEQVREGIKSLTQLFEADVEYTLVHGSSEVHVRAFETIRTLDGFAVIEHLHGLE